MELNPLDLQIPEAEQRTSSWEAWRKKGIGASDAPIIMGVSPWKTPLQLWEEKVGISKGFAGNWATNRGNELEPVARQHYELLADIDMPPCLVMHPVHLFMRASLDGYNTKESKVLEIKCPGRKDHETALAGKVPEKYIWQLQHQLFVTGAKSADYFSFDGEGGAIVTVYPDPKMHEELLEKCLAFWKCVETQTPPPATDRDYILVDLHSDEDRALVSEYRETLGVYQRMEKALAGLKAKLIERFAPGHSRVRLSGGVRILRSGRKGAIEYAKIPELQGVDLEKYRKPPVITTTVLVDDEGAIH